MIAAIRIAEQLAHDTRERLVAEGPLAIEETRRRIDARGCDVCDHEGFYILGRDVPRIHVCGCCHEDLTDLQRVYPDDVAQLPEAQAALAAARHRHAAEDERTGR